VKLTKISKKMQKMPTPKLVFHGANIGGTFDLTNAKLSDFSDLDLDCSGLDLTGADLDLDCSGLDLTGAVIGGTLLLASPQWSKDAQLILRNTHVSILQDVGGGDHGLRPSTWPSRYDLQGFVYDRVKSEMFLRPSEQYVSWLDRNAPFTTQPYQQLAAVFRAADDSNRADDVLYAARDHEMRENWRKGNCSFYGVGGECWNAVGLFLLKWSIGYGLGLGYFKALFWVAFFTGIGAAILWYKSEKAKKNGRWWCIWASLDHLLPIVEINKEFSEFFDRSKEKWLKGWLFAYFAIQSLIGYVLASFVVAGLAGLTQAQ
jgi:hypothetical protein